MPRVKGTLGNVYVRLGSNARNAVELGGMTTLRINGGGYGQGSVKVLDSTALTTFKSFANAGVIEVGEGVAAITLVEANGGTVRIRRPCTDLNVSSGVVPHEKGAVLRLQQRGGSCYYNAAGCSS